MTLAPEQDRQAARDAALAAMNPTQLRTFNDLLAIGVERPVARPGLVEELRHFISSRTEGPLTRWTEKSMWLSKGDMFSVLRCESSYLEQRRERQAQAGYRMMKPTAVGLVSHMAIQMSHTHPDRNTEDLVRQAVAGMRSDQAFKEFWESSDTATQSEVLVDAVSKTMGFEDSWPDLHPSWSPRFEERIQARVGKLTLSARVDLLLGRPRPSGQQTLLISDWKTGALGDQHVDEAAFYALVATLRFGVPPFRSTVYSLASGDWTDPDVTEEVLTGAAEKVVAAVEAMVDLLTDVRVPVPTAGRWCSWCPLVDTCPAASQGAAGPSTS